jgi:hypothetical protein
MRYFLFFALLLCFGCERSSSVAQYQNPFLEAISKSRTRCWVLSNASDTLSISRFSQSKDGYNLEYKLFGYKEITAYDSLGFIVQRVIIDDVPKNFFVSYSMSESNKVSTDLV